MPAVTLARLVADLQSLYSPPSKAIATWRKMRQVLQEFERLAGVRKSSDLTATAVALWLKNAPPRAPATTRTLLSSFRRVCAYARHKGWLRASPFDFRKLADWQPDYDPDDAEDSPPKHYQQDDQVIVLRHLATHAADGWEQARLFALIAVAAYTGARALEIQCALCSDFALDVSLPYFRVSPNERRKLKTKRSKRRVPLHPDVVAILAWWLPMAESIWAFPGLRRRSPWMGGSKGYRPLDQLQAACHACGVPRQTLNGWRHSLITHAAAWGIPDLISQKMAGHTQRKTTDGYRHWDAPDMRSSVALIPFGIKLPQRTA